VPDGKEKAAQSVPKKLRRAWESFLVVGDIAGTRSRFEKSGGFLCPFFVLAAWSGPSPEVEEQRIQPFQNDVRHNRGDIVSGLLSASISVYTNMIHASRRFDGPFFDSTRPIWRSSFSPSTQCAMFYFPSDYGALLQEQSPNPAIGQGRTGVRPCRGRFALVDGNGHRD